MAGDGREGARFLALLLLMGTGAQALLLMGNGIKPRDAQMVFILSVFGLQEFERDARRSHGKK